MASAIVKTLAALLLSLTHAAAAQAQDTPVPTAVALGVWMVQGSSALGSSANRNFISNACFVVTDEGVVVIVASKLNAGEVKPGMGMPGLQEKTGPGAGHSRGRGRPRG